MSKPKYNKRTPKIPGRYWHRCSGKSFDRRVKIPERILEWETVQEYARDDCPDCEFAGPVKEKAEGRRQKAE
jgi:hypothetical protein